jgi:hypothetical protein
MVLAPIGTLTADSSDSTLLFGPTESSATEILDVHRLGQLSWPGKEPYLVFSGRFSPNNKCLGHCDSETSIYLRSPSDANAAGITSVSGRYPGNYYESSTGSLVRQVRMFIGHCIDSRDAVVWFTHQSLAHRYPAEVDVMVVEDGGGLSFESLTSQQPPVEVAVAAVKKGTCKEIRPQQFRKSADYYAAEIPALTADGRCIVSPLGPGRPGRPLAYLDKRENILLYVESDGRHVAAINSRGDVLWVRDPFTDSKLCPYRSERPIVVQIGPVRGEAELAERLKTKGPLLLITFDSSQFGAVDLGNGNFFDLGQN